MVKRPIRLPQVRVGFTEREMQGNSIIGIQRRYCVGKFLERLKPRVTILEAAQISKIEVRDGIMGRDLRGLPVGGLRLVNPSECLECDADASLCAGPRWIELQRLAVMGD